jgi:hypothetical protein
VKDHRLVGFAILLVVIGGATWWMHERRKAPAEPTAVAQTSTARQAPGTNAAPPVPVRAASLTATAKSLDGQSFVDVRVELERRAQQGDAHAAARLGRTFAYCNGYVAASESQLETAVIEASAHGATVTDGGHALDPDALLARIKAGHAQQVRECAQATGVNEKNAGALALHWMERAAALGDADAKALYGGLAFADHGARSAIDHGEELRDRKRIAREYLQHSLASGDALALQQMSANYHSGTLFPADAEAAYRYLYAYSLTPRSNETAPEALAYALDEAGAALDDTARARARNEAQNLAACCMEPGAP